MFTTQHIPSTFPIGLINLNPDYSPAQQKVREKVSIYYLNLPGLEITQQPEDGKSIIQVQAEQARTPTYPDCDCHIKEVKPHTSFLMPNILDMPCARKTVVINITRRRWMCKSCHKTVTQPLEFMVEGHYKMTQRLLDYIEVQSLLVTELSLSEETGVFVRKIREIREKFVERLEGEVKFDTPSVLGLDGVRADSKRRRVILTDIEAGLVVDLLKSGRKENIIKHLRALPHWEKIRIVTVDMCNTLIPAVCEALPQAVIIIDLFHIVKTANKMMDAVRVRLYPRDKKKREPGQPYRPRHEPFRKRRATLSQQDLAHMEFWFDKCDDKYAELRLAYDLKEGFLEFFDEETYGGRLLMCKDAARQFYKNWMDKLPVGPEYEALLKNLEIILKPMDRRGEYVFNYFDHHYTNAFTESMNRKIKDILRDSRGCMFKTVHARIVFGTYLRKQRKADREQERKAVMPHSVRKRRQQSNPKSQSTTKGKTEGGKRSKAYKLPDTRQMAFNFTS
jgi:transposase